MRTSRRILYLSAEGLMQPLGQSQVVRLVEALAKAGFEYDLRSLERSEDLARTDALAALEVRFKNLGIGWKYRPYAPSAAANLRVLTQSALKAGATGSHGLIHGRAYHGALAGWTARRATGVPFLFDTRSYWLDERLEAGSSFQTGWSLAAARQVERRFFADSAAVVTLTQLQADDVLQGRFGGDPTRPIVCIPTCADYDDFVPGRRAKYRQVPAEALARLKGKTVFAFIGSINPSYLTEEMAQLGRLLLDRLPNAHLLALTTQQTLFSKLFERHGVPDDRRTIVKASHEAMPEWLSLVDWGFHFLKTSPAKRGSMPTKLAEFFAAGVRPIHHGCNDEVTGWIQRAGSGLVVDDLSPASLAAAADRVVELSATRAPLADARERTREHFSLETGVRRYAEILSRLGLKAQA